MIYTKLINIFLIIIIGMVFTACGNYQNACEEIFEYGDIEGSNLFIVYCSIGDNKYASITDINGTLSFDFSVLQTIENFLSDSSLLFLVESEDKKVIDVYKNQIIDGTYNYLFESDNTDLYLIGNSESSYRYSPLNDNLTRLDYQGILLFDDYYFATTYEHEFGYGVANYSGEILLDFNYDIIFYFNPITSEYLAVIDDTIEYNNGEVNNIYNTSDHIFKGDNGNGKLFFEQNNLYSYIDLNDWNIYNTTYSKKYESLNDNSVVFSNNTEYILVDDFDNINHYEGVFQKSYSKHFIVEVVENNYTLFDTYTNTYLDITDLNSDYRLMDEKYVLVDSDDSIKVINIYTSEEYLLKKEYIKNVESIFLQSSNQLIVFDDECYQNKCDNQVNNFINDTIQFPYSDKSIDTIIRLSDKYYQVTYTNLEFKDISSITTIYSKEINRLIWDPFE